MKIKAIGCVVLFLVASNASSAEFTKTTVIAKVISEAKRPAYPDVENNDFLELENNEQWGAGNSGCQSNVAVIPESKVFMRSVALAAITAGKQVEISVDNTLPKINGNYCQITLLAISK